MENNGEPPDVRNRIKEIRKMRLGDIAHNPMNWRSHPQEQRKAFHGLIKEVGWAGMPLVYKSERTGTLTYVDGHLRKEEFPDMDVQVAITDLNDAEADMLLATYDPVAALANTETELLETLLRDIRATDAGMTELLSKIAEKEGIIIRDIEFGEYDETIADGMEICKCERCGNEHVRSK